MRHPLHHSLLRGLATGGTCVLLALAAVALLAPSCSTASAPAGDAVRAPAVAGQFYPGDAARLAAAAHDLLADAVPSRGAHPIALVVPHAGWPFSGQIAADGWRQAEGGGYDLVVVLGPNHTTAGFRGVGVWARGGFRTPLGVMAVDSAAARALLRADPDCVEDAAVHAREHSIEVQLPFAQTLLPGARLLPLVVSGDDPAMCRRLGEALASVVHGRRALLVASSDLAHYPRYDGARASDRAVLGAIARLDAGGLLRVIDAQMGAGHPGLETCACGEAPVLAVLAAARALGATRGTVLSWANSGDTSIGDRARVVGYGAVVLAGGAPGADTTALAEPPRAPADAPLSGADQRALLAFARRSIARQLATGVPPLARGFSAVAHRDQGAFVTLRTRAGELRGCIGYMAEDEPLDQVVGRMAFAAAFEDRRFEPLRAEELDGLSIEISALTPLARVEGPDAVVIGRDGVQIRKDGRAAVFLPEVPVEEHWDRAALMENLCLKAGLARDAWRSGATFSTFRSIHFGEPAR